MRIVKETSAQTTPVHLRGGPNGMQIRSEASLGPPTQFMKNGPQRMTSTGAQAGQVAAVTADIELRTHNSGVVLSSKHSDMSSPGMRRDLYSLRSAYSRATTRQLDGDLDSDDGSAMRDSLQSDESYNRQAMHAIQVLDEVVENEISDIDAISTMPPSTPPRKFSIIASR